MNRFTTASERRSQVRSSTPRFRNHLQLSYVEFRQLVRQVCGASGIECCRRKRAKIAAQVHVRVTNSPELFEEVCKSIDVLRDGSPFHQRAGRILKRQQLEVTFPIFRCRGSHAADRGRGARGKRQVVRRHSVAVQFVAAKAGREERKEGRASDFEFRRRFGEKPAAAKQQSVASRRRTDAAPADIMRNLLQADGYTVIIVVHGAGPCNPRTTRPPCSC